MWQMNISSLGEAQGEGVARTPMVVTLGGAVTRVRDHRAAAVRAGEGRPAGHVGDVAAW